MTIQERLQFCKICTNRTMDFERGILCKLISEKADFEELCASFHVDDLEKNLQSSRYHAEALALRKRRSFLELEKCTTGRFLVL